ncbi:MAG: TonB-dependent receptor plug domain-containing protein [Bacteroidales bacterium]
MLLCVFLTGIHQGVCQKIPDTVNLPELMIKADARRVHPPVSAMKIPPGILRWNISSDLAGILNDNTVVSVRSYGRGGSASISLRGTMASHTRVLWNGVNINSPSLGQSDFSTIPVFFQDEIGIYFGTRSLSRVSGGFGGAIAIQNQPSWNDTLTISIRSIAGSFETFHEMLDIQAGNEKFHARTRLLYSRSANNFPFTNYDRPGNPEEKQENAAYSAIGGQQEFYFKPARNQTLTGILMVQRFDRNLPPLTVQSYDGKTEKQEDLLFRSLIRWEANALTSRTIRVQSGFLWSSNQYLNEKAGIDDRNVYRSVPLNLEFKEQLHKNLTLVLGSQNSIQQLESENYAGPVGHHIFSLSSALHYQIATWAGLRVVLREAWVQDGFSPLLPGLSFHVKPMKNHGFYIRGNIAGNYRNPSVNDLYWSYDGFAKGNPDLDPENGYASDVSLAYEFMGPDLTMQWKLTGYYNRINDLIQWQPTGKTGDTWMPENINRVNATGIEASGDIFFNMGAVRTTSFFRGAYTRSTFDDAAENLQDKQLIYTPLLKGNALLKGEYRGYALSWSILYYGKRYTVADNSRYLPGYGISDLSLSKYIQWRTMELVFEFRVNNLFDKEYRVISRHPMPGRNYLFTLSFTLKPGNHEKNQTSMDFTHCNVDRRHILR